MRIFFSSEGGDPMLLDREGGLHAFGRDLAAFADGGRSDAEFASETSGDPAPYDEFLRGLRVRKGSVEYAACHLADDRWLELHATEVHLKELTERIARLRDGDHAHLYSAPIGLIFEADNNWPGFNEV